MNREKYQILLTFDNIEDRDYIENEIKKDNLFRIQEPIYETYAADPMTIAAIVSIVFSESIKSITEESIKWIFEKLKTFVSKKEKSTTTSKKISIKLKIEDKSYRFIYDKTTEKHSLEEIK